VSVTLAKEGRYSQRGAKEPTRSVSWLPLTVDATPKSLAPHSPNYSEVVVALAPALDALGGNDDGHALRTTIIGMQMGGLLDLGQLAAGDLFYALLLKDIGLAAARAQRFHTYGELDEHAARLLHNADLTDLAQSLPLARALLASGAPLGRRLRNVTDLLIGSRRQPAVVVRASSRVAASLALDMGFSHGTAAALRSRSERWDGRGRPDGLSGESIPLAARIVAVADELDRLLATHEPAAAVARLQSESGRRFDPGVVKLADRLVTRGRLLEQLAVEDLEREALSQEPMQRRHVALAGRVDRLLAGVGRLIDSRSSWRVHHSERVRQLAQGAALQLPPPYRLSVPARRRLGRASLLHDIGKVSTPVALHDKPAALEAHQLRTLQGDLGLAERVLPRVLDLADAALVTETFVVAEVRAHDDADANRMDPKLESGLMTALVSLADRLEALMAPRPQRAGLSATEALEVLRRDVDESRDARREQGWLPGDEGTDPWAVALGALEAFVASPSAASLLMPRKFDPATLVVVD